MSQVVVDADFDGGSVLVVSVAQLEGQDAGAGEAGEAGDVRRREAVDAVGGRAGEARDGHGRHEAARPPRVQADVAGAVVPEQEE